MKTRITLSITMAMLLIGLGTVTAPKLLGRYYPMLTSFQNPVGTILNCRKKCGATTNEGLVFNTEGTGSATWLNNSAAGTPRAWSEIQISNFTAVGETPELGTITFSA